MRPLILKNAPPMSELASRTIDGMSLRPEKLASAMLDTIEPSKSSSEHPGSPDHEGMSFIISSASEYGKSALTMMPMRTHAESAGFTRLSLERCFTPPPAASSPCQLHCKYKQSMTAVTVQCLPRQGSYCAAGLEGLQVSQAKHRRAGEGLRSSESGVASS